MALFSKTYNSSASLDDFTSETFHNVEFDGLIIDFKQMIFDKKDDAVEFIDSLSMAKPDTTFVVRLKVPLSDFSNTEEYKEISQNIQHYQELIDNTPQSLLKKLKEQTSSKKGCKNCKSSISKEFFVKKLEKIQDERKLIFSDVYCPVCEDEEFLFSGTERKQFNRWIEKLNLLKEKLYTAEQKYLLKSDNFGIIFVYSDTNKNIFIDENNNEESGFSFNED